MIKFSPLVLEQIEWARELHNDPEVISMLTDPHIVSQEEQLIWFSKLEKSKSSKRLVVSDDQSLIGLIRLDAIDLHNKSICVGMDIHKDFRGKGYAKVIYKELLKDLFENQDFNRVWLLVADYNKRAEYIYLKMGFKVEGIQREALFKNNSYHNYTMMSILKKEYMENKNDSSL